MLVIVVLFGYSSLLSANAIKIAVASNFTLPMRVLVADFYSQSSTRVQLVSGSTSKLYSQILQGLPVDAFFAANREHPTKLELQNKASGRFTYALGKLVLVSRNANLIDSQGEVLQKQNFNHLALANPKHAPYGLAARQALQALGLWKTLRTKLVYGDNVGQAWQFVISGNAALGIVAMSQWYLWNNTQNGTRGSYWFIPQALYAPIAQQAVTIRSSAATEEFMRFMQSERTTAKIASLGYGLER